MNLAVIPMPATDRLLRSDAEIGPGCWVASTDGSCEPNPGRGGWGAVLAAPDGRRWAGRGGLAHVTNNQAELTAAIEALRRMPDGADAAIRADSKLVIHCALRIWGRNAPTLTALWAEYDRQEARMSRVRFLWVRGHAGDRRNNQADALAEAARLADDPGPRWRAS